MADPLLESLDRLLQAGKRAGFRAPPLPDDEEDEDATPDRAGGAPRAESGPTPPGQPPGSTLTE